MEQIDIMHYILRLARLAKRRSAGEHRLPRSAYMVLKILEGEDKVQLSDLAERLDIRASSLSEIISKMTNLELVDRIKDEDDSRIIYVSLSDEGRTQLKHNHDFYDELKNSVNRALTDDEKVEFACICEKLIAQLESMLQNDQEGCKRRHHRHMDRTGQGGHRRGKSDRLSVEKDSTGDR